MIKELVNLSFKTKTRSSEFRRNLLGIIILVIYLAVFLFRYINESFSIIGSILSASHTTIFSLFLKYFLFFHLVDLIIKILFKNNSLYIPPFLQTRPLSKKEWSSYIMFRNIFSLWNFYSVILLFPWLFKFTTINETLNITVLFWFGSILNNGICLWLKNYSFRLPIKTLFVVFIYLVLLGYEYIYIFNNQNISYVIANASVIVSLVIFAIFLYVYLFKQKKIYLADNLVKLRMESNKQEITMSLLKMEFIYILRSKRLLFAIPYMSVLLLAGLFIGDEKDVKIFIVLLLALPVMNLGQYILAIEANFFNGIWTKPILLKQLLETKYTFFVILTGIYTAIVFPFVLYHHLNILVFFSIALYIMFIFNLLMFPIALYSKRLDLSALTFFNTQGFSIMPFIHVIIFFCISGIFLLFIYSKVNTGWIFFSIILSMSVAFFFLRKWFLSIICSIFVKRRHKIILRYMSS